MDRNERDVVQNPLSQREHLVAPVRPLPRVRQPRLHAWDTADVNERAHVRMRTCSTIVLRVSRSTRARVEIQRVPPTPYPFFLCM